MLLVYHRIIYFSLIFQQDSRNNQRNSIESSWQAVKCFLKKFIEYYSFASENLHSSRINSFKIE